MNKAIKELITPCGRVTVIDENGKCIPFTIRKNLFDCPYKFENFEANKVILTTGTNYSLVIGTSDLIKGKHYRIMLNGIKLEFGNSDEKTECISGCSNGYCIALCTYLPNDDEKMKQAWNYSEQMIF